MARKNNDSNRGAHQLSFPFDFDRKIEPKSSDNNVVCFCSKRSEILNKGQNEKRMESINRLIEHAKKLNW